MIEVKAARGPRPKNLRGLFFSLQYGEQLAAQSLGRNYEVVFVVIDTSRRASFHVTKSWQELWSQARAIHVQFSVQF